MYLFLYFGFSKGMSCESTFDFQAEPPIVVLKWQVGGHVEGDTLLVPPHKW